MITATPRFDLLRLTHDEGLGESLKGLVLDLAIRGLLLDPPASSESVDDVIINTEARRAAAGLRPRPPRASGDRPLRFELPVGWAEASVGWLAEKLGAGSTPLGGKSVYQSSGVMFLRSQNVYPEGLRLDDVAYVSDVIHNRMSGTHVQANDILLNITGASIGRSALVPDELGPANVSQHVAIVRLHDPSIRRFVHLVFTSPYFQGLIREVEVGVSREGLSMRRLATLTIPIPPRAEQQRILGRVAELLHLCDELQMAQQRLEGTRDRLRVASLARLTRPPETPGKVDEEDVNFFLSHSDRMVTKPEHVADLRRTILELAVKGFMTNQDPSETPCALPLEDESPEAYSLPSSWRWHSLASLGDARLGKMLDKAKNRGRPQPYLRNVNVRWFRFDLSDVKTMLLEDDELEALALRPGDVMICEGGEPGRAAVWTDPTTTIYFQKALHRLRVGQYLDPHFLVLALKAAADAGRLLDHTTGTTFEHLTGRALAKVRVPVPPLAEQERIVAKVGELMMVCDELEQGLRSAEKGRAKLLEAVLHEALNGRVADAQLAEATG